MQSQNNVEKPKVSSLEEGDIFIELFTSNFQESYAVNEVLKQLSFHGKVYGKANGKSYIYHAMNGIHEMGVKRKYFEEDLPPNYFLGSNVVFRLKNTALSSCFIEMIKKWDIKPILEENESYYDLLETKKGCFLLPTRFSITTDRVKDEEDISVQRELFRAVRAYMRNQATQVFGKQNITVPMSKNKGVSCSNFIFYGLKAAIIKYLLDEKALKKIIIKMNQIGFMIPQFISFKLKKLEIEELKELEGLEKLIKEGINNSSVITDQNTKDAYFRFLCCPVKNYDIKDLAESLLAFSNLCELKGFLFYEKIIVGYDVIYKPRIVNSLSTYLQIKEKMEDSNNSFWIEESELSGLNVERQDQEEVKLHTLTLKD